MVSEFIRPHPEVRENAALYLSTRVLVWRTLGAAMPGWRWLLNVQGCPQRSPLRQAPIATFTPAAERRLPGRSFPETADSKATTET
jgi:hypothetical protein